MQTSFEKKADAKVVLKVVFDGQDWQQAQDKAFNSLATKVEIPGFRKGKAPLAAVRQRLGEEQILLEAANKSLDHMYEKALEDSKIEPIAQAEVNIVSLTADQFEAEFTVEVMPEVTLDPSYKDIQVKVKASRVTAKMIDEEVAKLQEENALWNLKTDGSVEKGDKVVLDYKGFKGEEAFEGGTAENFELEIGSNTFIPGFEDQMIGMKTDEDKDLNLTFPKEYPAKDLAGQEVVFKVHVHEIRSKHLPEVDDEFVKSLDRENITTVDELKASIKEMLSTSQKESNREEAQQEALKLLIEKASYQLPESLLKNEIQQLMNEFAHRMSAQGISMDLYQKLTNQDEEALRKQMEPEAKRRLDMRLVLDELAKVEALEATSDDIEKEYQTISDQYNIPLDQVKKMATPKQLAQDIIIKKAYDQFIDRSLV